MTQGSSPQFWGVQNNQGFRCWTWVRDGVQVQVKIHGENEGLSPLLHSLQLLGMILQDTVNVILSTAQVIDSPFNCILG